MAVQVSDHPLSVPEDEPHAGGFASRSEGQRRTLRRRARTGWGAYLSLCALVALVVYTAVPVGQAAPGYSQEAFVTVSTGSCATSPGTGWSSLTPPSRSGVSLAYDAAHGYLLAFGGITDIAGATPDGDTWEFKGGCWTQVCTSCVSGTSEPSARYNAGITYDTADGYVLLYGGCSTLGAVIGSSVVCGKTSSYYDSDAWEWTGSQWSQLCSSCSPGGREYPVLSYDSSDGYVVLFGGDTASAYCGDTWKYGGAGTWTELYSTSTDCVTGGTTCTSTTCPAVRSYAVMSYDAQDSEVVLFGGANGAGELQDTWLFKAGAWTECTGSTCTGTNEPGVTAFATMAYDPPHTFTLLVGGYSGTAIYSGFYWTFVGSTWTKTTTANVPAVQSAGMAYDGSASDGYVVLFGGATSQADQGTTWAFA